MHIISRKALASFWKSDPEAEKPLRVLFLIVEKTDFKSFSHLKQTFSSVDKIGAHTVFDIGGNKIRLITVIHYNRRKIYIRFVLTHREYDKGNWKKE